MVDKDGGAMHFSADKPGVDQVPPELLIEWGEVFSYGEKKYARDNWKRGTNWHEFYGSALRHIYKWWNGEDIDPETGLPHLAHALWNVGALRYYQLHGLGTDDRPEGLPMSPPSPEVGRELTPEEKTRHPMVGSWSRAQAEVKAAKTLEEKS